MGRAFVMLLWRAIVLRACNVLIEICREYTYNWKMDRVRCIAAKGMADKVSDETVIRTSLIMSTGMIVSLQIHLNKYNIIISFLLLYGTLCVSITIFTVRAGYHDDCAHIMYV